MSSSRRQFLPLAGRALLTVALPVHLGGRVPHEFNSGESCSGFNFRAAPFSIDGDELPGGRFAHLREGAGEPSFPSPRLRFAARYGDFARAWQSNDWNHFRIRRVGELPVITTWINGVKICELQPL